MSNYNSPNKGTTPKGKRAVVKGVPSTPKSKRTLRFRYKGKIIYRRRAERVWKESSLRPHYSKSLKANWKALESRVDKIHEQALQNLKPIKKG